MRFVYRLGAGKAFSRCLILGVRDVVEKSGGDQGNYANQAFHLLNPPSSLLSFIFGGQEKSAPT
jgi:hypothetical protein